MPRPKLNLATITMALCSISIFGNGALAQDDAFRRAQEEYLRFSVKGAMLGEPAMGQSRDAIEKARRDLQNAKSGEDRDKATSKLRAALEEYFDKDLESRQKSLDKLRARLDRMEELLAKRQGAKSDIVDLQLKVFVNDAQGMGFFRSARPETWLGIATEGLAPTAPFAPAVPVPPETPAPDGLR